MYNTHQLSNIKLLHQIYVLHSAADINGRCEQMALMADNGSRDLLVEDKRALTRTSIPRFPRIQSPAKS